MQAIISKELREISRLLPIGLLLVGICVWFTTPTQIHQLSSMNALPHLVAAGAAGFAVLLGAVQSWFDFSDRQRGFLFHRSVSRNRIFYGKVVAAAIVYAIAIAIPLACQACWFSWKGPDYLPVRPAQLLPTLILCIACFALHPATLFTIERDAKWYGTRLFPLLAAILALFIFAAILDVHSAWSALTIVAFAMFFILLLMSLQLDHVTRKVVLGIGAIAVVSIGLVLLTILVQQTTVVSTKLQTQYALDDLGNPWIYQSQTNYSANGYQVIQEPVSGDQLKAGKKLDLQGKLPDDFKPLALAWFTDFDRSSNFSVQQQCGTRTILQR